MYLQKHFCLQVIQATCVGAPSFIGVSRPMKFSALPKGDIKNYSDGKARWEETGREKEK